MNNPIPNDGIKEKNESPIACQRETGAFNTGQRGRYEAVRQHMQAAFQEVQELPDGYAFRFPAEPTTILTVAEFITLERLCCRFFNFVLEVKPEGGPLWLRLTGGEGVKELLQFELGLG
jgi:hypothetical protein